MEPRDEFAVLVARSFLGEEKDVIEATTLDALAEDARLGEGLDAELARAAKSQQQAGAFGMEIAAAFVIPVLIEIGRQLWESYSKELVSKLGNDLAKYTADRLKNWLKARVQTETPEVVMADLEKVICQVGASENLSDRQVAALITSVREGHVTDKLGAE